MDTLLNVNIVLAALQKNDTIHKSDNLLMSVIYFYLLQHPEEITLFCSNIHNEISVLEPKILGASYSKHYSTVVSEKKWTFRTV